jgi:hypothetical protein
VYVEGNPYIITVMTRGKDMEKLSELIGTVSIMTFDAMQSPDLMPHPAVATTPAP